jgi:flagellar P-ring protein precursor FlgI
MVGRLLIGILLTALGSAQAATTRIKDIAVIENVRPNQLVGYGLVVGRARAAGAPRQGQCRS